MNPLDEITLKAFSAALQKLEAPLPADLQRQLGQLGDDLEHRTDQLIKLIDTYPPLYEQYLSERELLQGQESQRQKRLVTTTQELLKIESQQSVSQSTVATQEPQASNGNVFPQQSRKSSSALKPAPMQRFALQANPTEQERQAYDRYIEELQRLNPDWVVVPDRPQRNEADAYLAIYNDGRVAVHHTAYMLTRFLTEASRNLEL